jgi:hypothetical protein
MTAARRRIHTRGAQSPQRRHAAAPVAIGLAIALSAAIVSPAGGVASICGRRTPVKTGNVSWKIRQASGLATVPSSPGLLFTHNDRGIRDSPAPAENTTDAIVWVINPKGTIRARFRLIDGTGTPIPYFDTEAIATDPSGRIVLADTGTNVDGRVTVALYRFTPPAITTAMPFTSTDIVAQVIPVQYFNTASSTTPVKLNVEAVTIDGFGAAWFVARTATLPYAYSAGAAALDQAATTQNPLRAVRSARMKVDGPMTDASISPDHTMLLVKSMTVVYAYPLAGRTVAAALGTMPCVVASAPNATAAGYGEAVTARDDGGFYTVKESSKTLHNGLGAPIWSFNP